MTTPMLHARSLRALSLTAALGLALVTAGCATGGRDAAETPSATTPVVEGPIELASMDDISALCTDADGPLVLSSWTGMTAAIDPALEDFTTATGVDVQWLENGTGDRLTKLNAEKGAPTIDVAIVPINEVPTLVANEVVEPTDTALPNYAQLTDSAKIDGGYGLSVLQFGLAYNPEYVTEAPTSWQDLLAPEYAGHIALPAMPNAAGYAILSMLTSEAGGTDADLSPGIEQIAASKEDIATFYPFSAGMDANITAGEVWIYPEVAGSWYAATKRGVPVDFVVPDEGGPAGLNAIVLPAGNDSAGCASALAAYMLGQQVQEAFAANLHYAPVSTLVDVPAELAGDLYPKSDDSLIPMDWTTIAENGPVTIDLWNRTVIG